MANRPEKHGGGRASGGVDRTKLSAQVSGPIAGDAADGRCREEHRCPQQTGAAGGIGDQQNSNGSTRRPALQAKRISLRLLSPVALPFQGNGQVAAPGE